MLPLPNVLQNFTDKTGKILNPWIQYLQQFTISPPAFKDIVVGTSPFSYETKEPGNLFISGGNVSGITLTRGADTITIFPNTSTPRLVPLSIDDIVTITYTVVPTIKFISSYGVDTHNF